MMRRLIEQVSGGRRRGVHSTAACFCLYHVFRTADVLLALYPDATATSRMEHTRLLVFHWLTIFGRCRPIAAVARWTFFASQK